MASSAGANTPLLPVTRGSTRNPYSWGFFKVTCCIRSTAARLVLLWNFAVLLAYRMLYSSDMFMQVSYHTSLVLMLLSVVLTFIAVFSPVAGLLTDIRFSRHRAVVCSSWFIIVKILCVLVVLTILLVGYFYSLYFLDSTIKRVTLLTFFYLMLAVFVTIYIIFIINALQFGMDQLHDSPTEDSVLFIHWYVWIYYACTFLTEIPSNLLAYDSYTFSLNSSKISGICSYFFSLPQSCH